MTYGTTEVVHIPRGKPYSARVLSEEGAEYNARIWRGPLTDAGTPRLDAATPDDAAGR